MKRVFFAVTFVLATFTIKAQTVININDKDVANYVGKEVTVCDSVYSARAMDNLSLMNLGGKFPKEIMTVVVFKADRDKFDEEPVNLFEHKRICVTGKLTMYKDKLQIVVTDPKQVK